MVENNKTFPCAITILIDRTFTYTVTCYASSWGSFRVSAS